MNKYLNIIILYLMIGNTELLLPKKKQIIKISFSFNSKYIQYLLTSLYSLFKNADKNTVFEFYMLVGDNVDQSLRNKILNLEKLYFNCFIYFFDLHDEFSHAVLGSLDQSTYYRLKLPILCPSVNRIIHLDTDSLVLKDLTELYCLNFEGKYIIGRLDFIVDELDHLGIKTNTYVNLGIMLIDLYNLRKYNYTQKFLDYIRDHNNYSYLNHHDQTLINYVCYDKIGIMSPKFHMWPFKNETEIKELNDVLRTKYNLEEFIEDYKNPYIIHYPGIYKKDMSADTIYHQLYQKYLKESEILNEFANITKNLR